MKDWFVIEASEGSVSGATCRCFNLQWEMGLPGPLGSSPLCSTNMFSVWKNYVGNHGIMIRWHSEHILNEILQTLSGIWTRWLDIFISSIKTDLLQGRGTSGLGHCWDRLCGHLPFVTCPAYLHFWLVALQVDRMYFFGCTDYWFSFRTTIPCHLIN